MAGVFVEFVFLIGLVTVVILCLLPMAGIVYFVATRVDRIINGK